VEAPPETDGEVAARVRMAEVRESLMLMDHLFDALPDGDIVTSLFLPPCVAIPR